MTVSKDNEGSLVTGLYAREARLSGPGQHLVQKKLPS